MCGPQFIGGIFTGNNTVSFCVRYFKKITKYSYFVYYVVITPVCVFQNLVLGF
jgi:hypothetical protein